MFKGAGDHVSSYRAVTKKELEVYVPDHIMQRSLIFNLKQKGYEWGGEHGLKSHSGFWQ